VIDDGVLVERLRELGELKVEALEELEAGRSGGAVEALVKLGDTLLALQELAAAERRLLGRLTRVVLRMLELGEQGRQA